MSSSSGHDRNTLLSNSNRGRTMIASDLDRTLIYSAAALQLPVPVVDRTVADQTVTDQTVTEPNLLCVELLDGKPQSFMTLDAALGLAAVAGRASFMPTTTRTMVQYLRVRFPGVAPEYAITSNGGNILVDGRPDENWRRATASVVSSCDATVSDVRQELERRSSNEWVLNCRVADDLFCYLVVDLPRMPDDFLESWSQWCEERGWWVSIQGRKIYSIPRPLTKERAMFAVADRLGIEQIFAAGDGALDCGFLAAATAGMRPPHGELDALDWQHPTVRVGPRAGVLAADDIVAWFTEQVSTHAAA